MGFKPWPVSIAGWVLSLASIAFCVQVFLFFGTVGSIPVNRTQALVICHAPAAYAPTRVREAASYLLQSSSATEDEQRVATEAIEWLRSKRDKPQPVAVKPNKVSMVGRRVQDDIEGRIAGKLGCTEHAEY